MSMARPLVLEGHALSCIRDDRVLFRELAFQVKNRQVLLLEGRNGSGKTSLLRILCGFREPDAGEVRWCGEPITDVQYRMDMAYIGHLEGIKKELTVLENLKVALALAQAGTCNIQEALARVQLAGFDDVPAQALSAGQKRRLSLARLLMTHNALWILDEPFTALDKQGIALIEQLMMEHCDQGGMIVLTSHHELNLPTVDVQRIRLS
ncbi:MAG: cytochrome c biogenesis heme-transporting ATPase CcmA [Methylovulum sp.]|nr:cytochrome c biogenesis heme-transporting ATPase CcmA [Methylovulum sp.]